MSRRIERVNELLRREISGIISSSIKDPRFSHMVSITRIDTSPDLRNARAYVSVLGSKTEKMSVLKVLKSASGFIRKTMIRSNITLRSIPSVEFVIDDAIEQGSEVLDLIRKVSPQTKDANPPL
jgi:ribosome-binding factor A